MKTKRKHPTVTVEVTVTPRIRKIVSHHTGSGKGPATDEDIATFLDGIVTATLGDLGYEYDNRGKRWTS